MLAGPHHRRYDVKTVVIELFSGPGGGKSVDCADVFSALKKRGVDAEMAREYAKRYAIEGTPIKALDELYILGSQVREESRLLGHVEVVVSDRPVLLSAVYAELYAPEPLRSGVVAAVRGYYATSAAQGFRRIAVLLPRRHKYEHRGRYEDEGGALLADRLVEQELCALHHECPFAGVYKYGDAGAYVDWTDVVVDVARMLRRTA